MSFKTFAAFPPARRILYRLARWRVAEKLDGISALVNAGDRVLDVGAGNCVLCEQLRSRGFDVTPIDLANFSFVPGIEPIVYDGRRLPFENDSFDVALVITVLHHTHDPDAILAELRRVAKRIIVVEEIYTNAPEKYLTYVIDSLFNLEFRGHPRSNRTDAGWKQAFQQLGLTIDHARYTRSLGVLRRVTYSLARA